MCVCGAEIQGQAQVKYAPPWNKDNYELEGLQARFCPLFMRF